MQELNWIHSNSFQFILDALKKPICARKLRLCACAALRHVFGQLQPQFQRAVEVAEALVEQHLGKQEVQAARRGVASEVEAARQRILQDQATQGYGNWYAEYVIGELPAIRLSRALELVLSRRDLDAQSTELIARTARTFATPIGDRKQLAAFDEEIYQSNLLRDIFGNPFRPVAFLSGWRTDTAVALARQMYESRDFGAMPILADALQDAGCDNEEILVHCRGDGPHVRGCWVVDLVLGKE